MPILKVRVVFISCTPECLKVCKDYLSDLHSKSQLQTRNTFAAGPRVPNLSSLINTPLCLWYYFKLFVKEKITTAQIRLQILYPLLFLLRKKHLWVKPKTSRILNLQIMLFLFLKMSQLSKGHISINLTRLNLGAAKIFHTASVYTSLKFFNSFFNYYLLQYQVS